MSSKHCTSVSNRGWKLNQTGVQKKTGAKLLQILLKTNKKPYPQKTGL
jgi:hypothetical protein